MLVEIPKTLTRISHQLSSRGRRGAVPRGVCDLRGADAYLTVRGAPRGEKTLLGAVHRRPQQKVGEICGLKPGTPLPPFNFHLFERRRFGTALRLDAEDIVAHP